MPGFEGADMGALPTGHGGFRLCRLPRGILHQARAGAFHLAGEQAQDAVQDMADGKPVILAPRRVSVATGSPRQPRYSRAAWFRAALLAARVVVSGSDVQDRGAWRHSLASRHAGGELIRWMPPSQNAGVARSWRREFSASLRRKAGNRFGRQSRFNRGAAIPGNRGAHDQRQRKDDSRRRRASPAEDSGPGSDHRRLGRRSQRHCDLFPGRRPVRLWAHLDAAVHLSADGGDPGDQRAHRPRHRTRHRRQYAPQLSARRCSIRWSGWCWSPISSISAPISAPWAPASSF